MKSVAPRSTLPRRIPMKFNQVLWKALSILIVGMMITSCGAAVPTTEPTQAPAATEKSAATEAPAATDAS